MDGTVRLTARERMERIRNGGCLSIRIDNWDYMLFKNRNGRGYNVWHQVTPADGGYGTQVNVTLPETYFKEHTVEEFFRFIASQQVFNRGGTEEELRILESQLRNAGWID